MLIEAFKSCSNDATSNPGNATPDGNSRDPRPVFGISTPSRQMTEEEGVCTDEITEVEEEVEEEEGPTVEILFDVTLREDVAKGVQTEDADVEVETHEELEPEKLELEELELKEFFGSDLKKPVNMLLCCFNSCACLISFSVTTFLSFSFSFYFSLSFSFSFSFSDAFSFFSNIAISSFCARIISF